MSDLEIAKSLLVGDNTCVLVSGDKKYISTKSGIRPVLEYLDEGTDLTDFVVADRIVGKAAALLFVLAKIKCVYAEVISEPAILILKQHNIEYSYGKLTKNIINRKGDGICPMEQTVLNTDDPQTAFELLKAKVKELSAKK